MRVTARRLTAEAFAPFGQVIHTHAADTEWRQLPAPVPIELPRDSP